MPQSTFPGFKGVDGTVYRVGDARLVGYGNPPNDPEYARANPGAGHIPLQRCLVTIDKDGNVTEAPAK